AVLAVARQERRQFGAGAAHAGQVGRGVQPVAADQRAHRLAGVAQRRPAGAEGAGHVLRRPGLQAGRGAVQLRALVVVLGRVELEADGDHGALAATGTAEVYRFIGMDGESPRPPGARPLTGPPRRVHGRAAKVGFPPTETTMLATTYRRQRRMRIAHVADPVIEHPNDAIVRVTRSCICGSDIHIYNGLVPDTREGSIIGHEFCGVVEEVGPSVRNLKAGDRVLVPFADVGPSLIPDDIHIEDAVLLTDAFPAGYQAAEMGSIREGDTVVVFGAGPVGLFAARSAWFFGADACIDAVGCDASGSAFHGITGKVLMLQAGSPIALHWAINSARKGGRISTVGVYGPTFNMISIGNAVSKGLTLRMNQASVRRHLPRLIEHIRAGHISPREVITHRIPLEEVADAYDIFV